MENVLVEKKISVYFFHFNFDIGILYHGVACKMSATFVSYDRSINIGKVF